MSRYIDADDALKLQIDDNTGDHFALGWNRAIAKVATDLPTADVATVVHAHFVPTEYDGYADGYPVYDTWECSNCSEEFYNEGEEPAFCYCPYCGARMDEEETP